MAYYNPYPYAYPQSYSNNIRTMEWVEGEVGAKAYQMPQGWPPETPIALWDNAEKKIYLKSWNAMGMPNPMQELTYEIKEKTNPALLQSGDTSQFVTKDDLSRLKNELQDMIKGLQNNGNRGGNR